MDTVKVVYNACYGGFSVSEAGMRRYAELKGLTLYPEYDPKYSSLKICTYWIVPPESRPATLEGKAWQRATVEERVAANVAYANATLDIRGFKRSDPILVRVVEELGDAASGDHAKLKIEEIPAGSQYRIDEYDGSERVMTRDSYEWETA